MRHWYIGLFLAVPVLSCLFGADSPEAYADSEIPGGVMGTVYAHVDSLDPPWSPRSGVLVLVETAPQDSLPAPKEVTVIVRDARMEPKLQVAPLRASLRILSRSSSIQTIVAEDETGRRLFSIALPMPGLEVVKRLELEGFISLYPKNRGSQSGVSVLVMPNLGSAVTDSAGAFLISGVPPECRSVWAIDPRLGSVVDSVCVEPARATEIELYLPYGLGTSRETSREDQKNSNNDIVD